MKKILLTALMSTTLIASKLNYKIILGSARDKGPGKNIAKQIKETISKDKDIEVEVINPKDFNLPFFESPVSPAYATRYENEDVKKWADKIAQADAFVILAPEYNHSFPALLKNAMDSVYKEWNYKPVIFIGYSGGISGGVRAIEQLKLVSLELKMVPLRPEVNIPQVWRAFEESSKFADKEVYKQIEGFADELKNFATMLKDYRSNK